MSWFQTVPTILVAVLLVFAPGAVLARSLGIRGMAWLGFSAPLSISLIAVAAIGAQILGVRWSLPVLLVSTVAASAVAWGIRYLLVIRKSSSREPLWVVPTSPVATALVGGLVLGAAIISTRVINIFGRPEDISQTYDNVFHLNAIRKILDTGNGSSLYLGDLESSGSTSAYPGAWHDLVSLVIQTTNVPIPVGVNAVNLVLAALVWTVSALYLSTRILGVRPAAFLVTGAMAGAFSAFPYLLLNFGVLYPNFLAISLLPAFIALAADTLRLSVGRRPTLAQCLVILVLAAPGLALSHPSVALAFGAFVAPMLLAWLLWQGFRRFKGTISWTMLVLSFAAVLAYCVLLPQIWQRVRPTETASFWPPTQTIAQAMGEAFANAPMRGPISWVLVVLTVLGLYAISRNPRQWWFVGPFAIGIYFYVVVSGFAKGDLRSFFTGVFYNDSYRLAAMLPVMALPLTVIAALWIYDAVAKRIADAHGNGRSLWLSAGVLGTIAALLLAFVAQNNTVDAAQADAANNYALTPDAKLLSTDEAALLARADSKIPEGATVIANPATGASLVYALANRRVILPAVGSTPSKADQVLMEHLAQLETDPAVCSAVRSLGAFYVLDFGSQQVNKMDIPFPTSEALATTPGLTLLDQEGPAKLYRIDACK